MTKISTYPIDTDVTGADKWIGTDSDTYNQTKNFTPVKLAKYFNNSEIISIGTNLRYVYDILEVGEERKYGTITFDPQQGSNVPFSSISTFILSKFTIGGKNVEQYIQKLEGSQIVMCNSDNPNSFGVFDITSVTQIILEPNFYTVVLEFVDGYGNLVEDKSYAFQLIRFGQDAPSGVTSVTGNIVDNTDPLNPIVTQVQSDWNAVSGLGAILNKPTIPTKTSDLTNDGEDGVNPFISQEQVVEYPNLASFPPTGIVGVVYIALDTDLAYVWDTNTLSYVLTSMPDTGITGIGKTNRIAKFNSPTSIVWSKIFEDPGTGSVKIVDSNRSFLDGNSVLSVQRSQSQVDIVLGNPGYSQPSSIWSDNQLDGFEVKSKGILSLKAGTSYLEGLKVLTTGKLQITQTPDTGTTSDYLLLRDSSGNVKQIVYPTIPSAGVTSVGLTMPSAFTVTNSPITSSGDITVTGAGSVSQYVRGDGTLANFPNSTGGGSSVNYYLNGSVSQGTFGGNTYYQMSKTPILGGGTNFIRTNGAGNGYIASFITDAGDPSFLNIPGGNWNLEFYFQSSASGGSPQFYAEIYKVSATNVFTLVASGSTNPEGITNGITVDQYYTSIPVPQTSLLITDRLAVRIYVITSGRTITLHTENGNLCEVLTTFTTGLTALNGLTQQVQYFDVGTGATNFNISSSGDTHTFNLLFNIRRNANNTSNDNINYCGTAPAGSSESATVWSIVRLTVSSSGSVTTATATNAAWTNRQSVIYT